MPSDTEPKRPSLLRQLLGAAAGALVALMLYQAYKISAPIVTAWVVAPQSQINADYPGSVRVNREVDEYQFSRIAAKAKEIYGRFAAEPAPQASRTPEGIEVTQPAPAVSSATAQVDLNDLMAASSVSSVSSVLPEETLPVTTTMAESETLPPVGYDEASSARARAESQLQARLAGEQLPSSGIGTAIAASAAFGAALLLRRKRGSQ